MADAENHRDQQTRLPGAGVGDHPAIIGREPVRKPAADRQVETHADLYDAANEDPR
jgi:hypothetical protein